MRQGFCIWLTGPSASGKTTLAWELSRALLRPVTVLDGDEVRRWLTPELGYSAPERAMNVARIARVAAEIVAQGGIVIVACISPQRAPREMARQLIGGFYEVRVVTPLEARLARDTKGIYAHADADLYEEGSPELIVSGTRPVGEAALEVLAGLRTAGYLGTALLIGRWQPWHEGHTKLFERALSMEGFAAIGVRNRKRTDSDPFDFDEVSRRIDEALSAWRGRYEIIPLPDVTNVVYGRRVGYRVTPVELDEATEALSATRIREKINAQS